jgi:K(+)-stimulated pyrophosphate-energized sodium pump
MSAAVAWLAPLAAMIGLGVAAFLGTWVLKQDPGNEKMQEISKAIQEGAMAFLKREWRVLIIFAAFVFAALSFSGGSLLKGVLTGASFLTGGLLSATAGFIGMYVATRANSRTAQAATEGIHKALNVAFRSGLTMGLTVASFGVLGMGLWTIFLVIYGDVPQPEIVNGFAMGASSIALFARVGGGIFTKAADVGADLVGKVEAGIPEDDPRNPAVIADNVGDNVGDVAGMGADLYESYVGSILAPIVLALTLWKGGTVDVQFGVIVPLLIAGAGIIASVIGLFATRVRTWPPLSRSSPCSACSGGGPARQSPLACGTSAPWSRASRPASRSARSPSTTAPTTTSRSRASRMPRRRARRPTSSPVWVSA